VEQAKILKQILDDFASTTGLKINFSKSTFVPINLTMRESEEIANALNCDVASFPQVYLGLPLSDSKLPKEVFLPYILAVESRIGFSLHFITRGGRLTLTKSVLSALPAYLMSCFKLPQWVIDELERLLRAFFWKGKNSVNGSDCLVAWDYVCRSYEEGGLGIKNLRIQNDCLLTKFVHRFLTQPNSPWARWVVATHLQGKDFGDRPTTQTRVWKQMWGLIDTYRNATCVQLGDGITTSLWKDKWTSDGPLCFQFPALFSHTSRPNISVADCWRDGVWTIPFNHITSDRADQEKEALFRFLGTCNLQNLQGDKRGWRLDKTDCFSVSNLYNIMNWGGIKQESAESIWRCAAPKKGKIFAWLLIKGRIKVRAVLLRQNIVDDERCPFGCKERETTEHFALNCGRTIQILALLGINLTSCEKLTNIFDTARERCPPQKKKAWTLVITAALWSTWLARNRKVFDDVDIPVHIVAKQCIDTCKLWTLRAKHEEKASIQHWLADWTV
jgi:hypothetical protein